MFARPGPGRTLVSAALLSAPMLLFGPAPSACACSCVPRTMAEQTDAANVIFRATVLGRSEPRTGSSAEPIEYRLDVAEVYRGITDRSTVVRSAADEASCGLTLTTGTEYLLFTTADGDGLRASLCGGTVASTPDLVTQVVALNGPGRAPMDDPVTVTTTEPVVPDRSPLVAGGIALFSAALAALAWWRQRRRDP